MLLVATVGRLGLRGACFVLFECVHMLRCSERPEWGCGLHSEYNAADHLHSVRVNRHAYSLAH